MRRRNSVFIDSDHWINGGGGGGRINARQPVAYLQGDVGVVSPWRPNFVHKYILLTIIEYNKNMYTEYVY